MEYVIDEKVYKLHYSIKRVETIESATGISIASIMMDAAQKKLPQISLVENLFAYGLMDEGGVYAPIKKALEFAEKQLMACGYPSLLSDVLDTLTEDCGFLFQDGSSNSNI